MIPLLVAVAIGAAIMAVAVWSVRLLATPPPPEPDPDAVVEVTREYRCSVCGLKLVVTHAGNEDFPAPRHCREEMEPVD